MLPIDKIRGGQIVAITGGPDFPLPEGVAEGTLARVALIERNGLVLETQDGRRLEINGVLVMPQVNETTLKVLPAATMPTRSGPFAPVQDPALDHSGIFNAAHGPGLYVGPQDPALDHSGGLV